MESLVAALQKMSIWRPDKNGGAFSEQTFSPSSRPPVPMRSQFLFSSIQLSFPDTNVQKSGVIPRLTPGCVPARPNRHITAVRGHISNLGRSFAKLFLAQLTDFGSPISKLDFYVFSFRALQSHILFSVKLI